MLRATVGVSRKVPAAEDARGFTLNLEGEILATIDDPESVIERIRELYSVAEEALDRQVAEAREIDSFASRDAEGLPPPPRIARAEVNPDGSPTRGAHREPATDKQIRFLTTLAKRRYLIGAGLEGFIGDILGRRCRPGDLNRKEAGAVIDALNAQESGGDRAMS